MHVQGRAVDPLLAAGHWCRFKWRLCCWLYGSGFHFLHGTKINPATNAFAGAVPSSSFAMVQAHTPRSSAKQVGCPLQRRPCVWKKVKKSKGRIESKGRKGRLQDIWGCCCALGCALASSSRRRHASRPCGDDDAGRQPVRSWPACQQQHNGD